MLKKRIGAYSRYAQESIELLGQLIRIGRIERKMTVQEFAARVGISRGLLQRIEKGDPSCGIGSAFEAAAIAGVQLFDANNRGLWAHLTRTKEKLSLLPNAVRQSTKPVEDDF